MLELEKRAQMLRFAWIPPLLVPIDVVRGWLLKAQGGGDEFLEAAFLAGQALIARKRSCPRGSWVAWQSDMLAVDRRICTACTRIYLTARMYGGCLPTRCLGTSLWAAESALPPETSHASNRVGPAPGVTTKPWHRHHEETVYELAADAEMLALLAPDLQMIREADDPLVTACDIVSAITAYGQVEARVASAIPRHRD